MYLHRLQDLVCGRVLQAQDCLPTIQWFLLTHRLTAKENTFCWEQTGMLSSSCKEKQKQIFCELDFLRTFKCNMPLCFHSKASQRCTKCYRMFLLDRSFPTSTAVLCLPSLPCDVFTTSGRNRGRKNTFSHPISKLLPTITFSGHLINHCTPRTRM